MTATTQRQFIDTVWSESIVPILHDYIRIPAKSPMFDQEWEAHGHIDRATALIADWCRAREIADLTVEVVRLPGRTPLIFMEIPGASQETVLLYGHLDKQPEMTGWRDDLGPWEPLLEGDLLYGRGGADDGYAAFASLTAIEALQRSGRPHARCVVLIEASEESGSPDLPAYMDHLSDRIGTPGLVVCLDSGAGDYERMWTTTSLRGNVVGNLTVDVLREGVHSGAASGIAASSFRVARMLLDRVEEADSGRLTLPSVQAEVPPDRIDEARAMAACLGESVWRDLPFVDGMGPVDPDPMELILNSTWRATLCVTGADGLPPLRDGGNVLRPQTSLKLSLRLPPTADAHVVNADLKRLLESDPPYGASVMFAPEDPATGWNAPALAPWLRQAMDAASQHAFGNPALAMGEGGSIPFMHLLGERYPQAQFLITGVLGPRSNAHGPNEFLHVPMARKLTACVADVVADHHRQFS